VEHITISKIINIALGGGLPRRLIALLYGPPASGKSLFCLSACNSSPSSCYIDAKSHLSAFSLLKHPESTAIYRPNSFVEFEQAIDRATRAKFPLIVIDSFTRFYLDSINERNFTSYNHALSSLLSLLSSYARKESAAVLLTTGISSDSSPIGGALFGNIPVKIRLEPGCLHLERSPFQKPKAIPFSFSGILQ